MEEEPQHTIFFLHSVNEKKLLSILSTNQFRSLFWSHVIDDISAPLKLVFKSLLQLLGMPFAWELRIVTSFHYDSGAQRFFELLCAVWGLSRSNETNCRKLCRKRLNPQTATALTWSSIIPPWVPHFILSFTEVPKVLIAKWFEKGTVEEIVSCVITFFLIANHCCTLIIYF